MMLLQLRIRVVRLFRVFEYREARLEYFKLVYIFLRIFFSLNYRYVK